MRSYPLGSRAGPLRWLRRAGAAAEVYLFQDPGLPGRLDLRFKQHHGDGMLSPHLAATQMGEHSHCAAVLAG